MALPKKNVTFQIKGSKATSARVDENSEVKTRYVEQWFNVEFVAAEEKVYFLRKGGVRGAEMKEFSHDLVNDMV